MNDNSATELGEIGCKGVKWIHLAQVRDLRFYGRNFLDYLSEY
jgi:hypothetical protein